MPRSYRAVRSAQMRACMSSGVNGSPGSGSARPKRGPPMCSTPIESRPRLSPATGGNVGGVTGARLALARSAGGGRLGRVAGGDGGTTEPSGKAGAASGLARPASASPTRPSSSALAWPGSVTPSRSTQVMVDSSPSRGTSSSLIVTSLLEGLSGSARSAACHSKRP
ncbi:hypothetical protein GCM10020220_014390 [Nonomuraea rubra]